MRLEYVKIEESYGGLLVHTHWCGGQVFKKGLRIDEICQKALQKAGIASLMVARLEAGDILEDEAASTLGQALAGSFVIAQPAFTGRCNLIAHKDGLCLIDRKEINRFNGIDETITLATLSPYTCVKKGDRIATLKIIPFSIPHSILKEALKAQVSLKVIPFLPLRIAVISTYLPHTKKQLMDKTIRILEQRLSRTQASIMKEQRIAHEIQPIVQALEDLRDIDVIIIFGASAIVDRADVIPQALVQAGGRVDHLGLPVDPGNLLLMGHLSATIPIIGAPGCARSPQENGFDWVLYRLLVGLDVTSSDLMKMGAGGLLHRVQRESPLLGEEEEEA